MAKKSDTASVIAMPAKDNDYEAREREYRARADMRTLGEAMEIKADKERHKAAKAMAQEELDKMSSIAEAEPKDTTEKNKESKAVESKSGDTKPKGKESIDRFMKRRESK